MRCTAYSAELSDSLRSREQIWYAEAPYAVRNSALRLCESQSRTEAVEPVVRTLDPEVRLKYATDSLMKNISSVNRNQKF